VPAAAICGASRSAGLARDSESDVDDNRLES